MKLHPTIDRVPTKYEPLARAVDRLVPGEILPIECEDLVERKNCWDFLRYHFPDLVMTLRERFLFASKGNFNAFGKAKLGDAARRSRPRAGRAADLPRAGAKAV